MDLTGLVQFIFVCLLVTSVANASVYGIEARRKIDSVIPIDLNRRFLLVMKIFKLTVNSRYRRITKTDDHRSEQAGDF